VKVNLWDKQSWTQISFLKVCWCCLRKIIRYGSHSDLQITPYLSLPRKHSPDGASPDWGCGHLIAAYYSFIYPERMKGWVGLVGWLTADGLPISGHPSAAGQAQDSESSPVRDRRSIGPLLRCKYFHCSVIACTKIRALFALSLCRPLSLIHTTYFGITT